MAVIRLAAVFKNASGLARDQVVNTFHFNGAITDANLTGLMTAVASVYNGALPAPLNAPLGRFLSNQLTTFDVKAYDVTNEPSGPPIAVKSPNGLPNRISAQDLPEEVAVCGSFESLPAPGLIQTRRRGRVYFGPFNTAALTGQDGLVQRPNTDLLLSIRVALARLAVQADPFAEWVVYSRPFEGRAPIVRPGRSTLPAIAARPGTAVNIERVWTDNDFDTQRRRGMRATAKTFLTTGE